MEEKVENDLFPNSESETLLSRIKRIPTKYLLGGIGVVAVGSILISSVILISSKDNLSVPNLEDTGLLNTRVNPTVAVLESELATLEKELTPAPTLSPDAIASWSAFQSLRYGYSFDYPLNWTAVRTAQTDPLILDYVVLNPTGNATGSAITFSYSTRTPTQALAIYSQQGTPIMVNNIPATQKVLQDSQGNTTIQIVIPDGQNTAIWYAQSAYQNILNGILSTFEFL